MLSFGGHASSLSTNEIVSWVQQSGYAQHFPKSRPGVCFYFKMKGHDSYSFLSGSCSDITFSNFDSIQKDFDRIEEWACAHLMKFDGSKYKVLHIDCEWIESDMQSWTWPKNVCSQPRTISWAGWQEAESGGRVRGFSPLFCSGETPSGALWSQNS